MKIDREVERQLIVSAKDGDSGAISALVKMHAGMVHRVAQKYRCQEDIESVAALAMWKAARDFRPERGHRFITYAGWKIAGEIRDANHFAQSRADRKRTYTSLDAVTHSGARLSDLIAGDEPQPLDEITESDETARVQAAIDGLNPQMQRVIRGRMNGKILKEIARELGVSRQRVHQLETEAEQQLRVLLCDQFMLPRVQGARWQPIELDYLHQQHPTKPMTAIARELGRGYTSVIRKATSLDLRKIDQWTTKKDAFLRANRGEGWQWCAQKLGLTPTAVHNRVRRLGIQFDQLLSPADRLTLTALWKQGKVTTEIAAVIGCSAECVRVNLHRLSFCLNKRNEKKRMATYRERHVCASVASLVHRRRLAALGYSDMAVGQALILEALKRLSRPADKYALAKEIAAISAERGWKRVPGYKSIGAAARKLVARGLLCRSKRGETGLATHWLPSIQEIRAA